MNALNIKALQDYIKYCKTKRTVPSVQGLKQFYKDNKLKYKIA